MIEASIQPAAKRVIALLRAERRLAAACLLLSVLAHVVLLARISLPGAHTPVMVEELRTPMTLRLVPAAASAMPPAATAPAGAGDSSPTATTLSATTETEHIPAATLSAPTPSPVTLTPPPVTPLPPRQDTPMLPPHRPTTVAPPQAPRDNLAQPAAAQAPPTGRPRIDLDAARALARQSGTAPDPRPSTRNLAPTPADAPIVRDRVEAAIARATALPELAEHRAADGSWMIETDKLRCQVTPGMRRPPALEGTPYTTLCGMR